MHARAHQLHSFWHMSNSTRLRLAVMCHFRSPFFSRRMPSRSPSDLAPCLCARTGTWLEPFGLSNIYIADSSLMLSMKVGIIVVPIPAPPYVSLTLAPQFKGIAFETTGGYKLSGDWPTELVERLPHSRLYDFESNNTVGMTIAFVLDRLPHDDAVLSQFSCPKVGFRVGFSNFDLGFVPRFFEGGLTYVRDMFNWARGSEDPIFPEVTIGELHWSDWLSENVPLFKPPYSAVSFLAELSLVEERGLKAGLQLKGSCLTCGGPLLRLFGARYTFGYDFTFQPGPLSTSTLIDMFNLGAALKDVGISINLELDFLEGGLSSLFFETLYFYGRVTVTDFYCEAQAKVLAMRLDPFPPSFGCISVV